MSHNLNSGQPQSIEGLRVSEYTPIGLSGMLRCGAARRAYDQCLWPASPRPSYHPPPCGSGDASTVQYSQAVDHRASLPPIVLLLPLLQPPDHFEQRALGGGRVPVGGPADVLEVLDYAVPVLRLWTERLLGPLQHWAEDRLNEV